MFKLPNNTKSFQKLRSYQSNLLQKNAKSPRKPPVFISHTRQLSVHSQNTKKQQQVVRPKSSYIRVNTQRKTGNLQIKQLDLSSLISPCNRKLKFSTKGFDYDSIQLKMSNSDFLLEPCKNSTLSYKTKAHLQKLRVQFEQKKYVSPYIQIFKPKESRNLKYKPKMIRQKNKSIVLPIMMQQLIQPWKVNQNVFQSIKLNQSKKQVYN